MSGFNKGPTNLERIRAESMRKTDVLVQVFLAESVREAVVDISLNGKVHAAK